MSRSRGDADGSDNGTSTYDSSEKARIPAWTDRILARGAVDLKAYKRAELYSSDHRPVYALYVAEIREVDQGKKESIRREVTGHVGGLDLDEQGVKDVLGEKRECEFASKTWADDSG